jgi:hypothetical protein
MSLTMHSLVSARLARLATLSWLPPDALQGSRQPAATAPRSKPLDPMAVDTRRQAHDALWRVAQSSLDLSDDDLLALDGPASSPDDAQPADGPGPFAA